MIEKKTNRRRFLKGVLVAGGAAALGGAVGTGALRQLASAIDENGRDQYYVFAYFGGGWDVLLSLDPRDPARFNADAVRDTRILPGYEMLDDTDGMLVNASANLTFGPFIGDLARHASRLAVVRGMSMDTLTHDVGRRRFLTGKPPSGLQARGSSGSTWLASRYGELDPIPNLSVRVETYNTQLPNYASGLRVGNASDLVDMLRRADPQLPDGMDLEIGAMLEAEADCPRASHSALLRTAESSRQRVQTLIDRDLAALFDFRASTPEMDALRGRYGIGSNLSSPGAQAAIAAQALMNDVTRCVSIQPAGGLDTHYDDWQRDQGPRQRAGFDAIATLVDHLAETPFHDTGESWLDRTTIIGFSEFSRTPMINDRGGRDHWLGNSCFLIGGNVRGDTVIGASSDVGMQPRTVDVSTGLVDPGGEIIRPEHVLRSLMVDAGIAADLADLRVEPIAALMRG